MRTVPSGHPIRVHTGAQQQKGTFVAVEGDTLQFKTVAGTEVKVSKSDVEKVYSQSPSHRRRNFIIGAIIGVAVGAVAYGTLGALLENEGADDVAGVLFVPIAVGGAVGAALPTGRMKLVYDAKRP
jgi:hypothetical protein